MLVGLKECLAAVVEGFSTTKAIGNIKVEYDTEIKDFEIYYVYHYNNCVAVINVTTKKIGRSQKWWNYSRSTTRLCNDLIKYFSGYEVI